MWGALATSSYRWWQGDTRKLPDIASIRDDNVPPESHSNKNRHVSKISWPDHHRRGIVWDEHNYKLLLLSELVVFLGANTNHSWIHEACYWVRRALAMGVACRQDLSQNWLCFVQKCVTQHVTWGTCLSWWRWLTYGLSSVHVRL